MSLPNPTGRPPKPSLRTFRHSTARAAGDLPRQKTATCSCQLELSTLFQAWAMRSGWSPNRRARQDKSRSLHKHGLTDPPTTVIRFSRLTPPWHALARGPHHCLPYYDLCPPLSPERGSARYTMLRTACHCVPLRFPHPAISPPGADERRAVLLLVQSSLPGAARRRSRSAVLPAIMPTCVPRRGAVLGTRRH